MQKKKIAIVLILFAITSFLGVAFFIFYKPAIEKTIQKKSQFLGGVTGDLPELVCDYASDQEAYRNAVISESVGQCECVKDSNLKDVCKKDSMDMIFYNRAISYFDITLCDRIDNLKQKDACKKVVTHSISQLEEDDPQHLANIYASTHNEKAIDQLEVLIHADSDNIENYILLALAYAQKGLSEKERGRDQIPYVEKAFLTIASAKKIDNKNSHVYRAEAYINEIVPDHEKALELYTKSIELDPDNVFAYAGRGHVYRARGNYDDAISDFEKAAELDVEDQNIFIYTNLCNLEYSRNNDAQATKNCKIVVAQDNGEPLFQSEAHQILAMLYMKNFDYKQARNALLTAKTLVPNDPNLYVTFSKLSIFENDYVDAEIQAHKAIEIAPTKATAYLALAHALYMQKRFDDAIIQARFGIDLVAKDISLLASSKPEVERDLYYVIANSYGRLGDSAKQAEYDKKGKEVFEDHDLR
jgi:tetratricopeptide (TPR) repeat protein